MFPEVEEIIPQLTLPFIVIHGKDDVVACPTGSEFLYNCSKTAKADKCIVLLEGTAHSKNFSMQEQARDILPWLAKQLHKRSAAAAAAARGPQAQESGPCLPVATPVPIFVEEAHVTTPQQRPIHEHGTLIPTRKVSAKLPISPSAPKGLSDVTNVSRNDATRSLL
jgi:hypothetical protein